MSGFANRLRVGGIFNRAAYAGPRRFVIMGAGAVAVAGAITYVSMSGAPTPPQSQVGHLPSINPLPGGLQSDPQQDKLALETNQQEADHAAKQGLSYTPPIAASQPVTPPPSVPVPVLVAPAATIAPLAAAPVAQPAPQPLRYVAPDPMTHPLVQTVAADPQEQQMYTNAVNKLLRGWDRRSPKTDVMIQPASTGDGTGASGAGQGRGGVSGSPTTGPTNSYLNRSVASNSRRLLPAGRGVFAHTVLAASSDSQGPVVLQADTGPLAGDRMIGSFGKATANGSGSADRLIVRVNTIEHNGQSIGVDAIVIAPDTMETTVASSVDEHYISRFALPAAAAFVQGLGQALATTSNTVGVLSPFGGSSYATQLNIQQQLGVAAGVAAQQIGHTLNQQAPQGPTVHLDANANVGVMFLADVNATNTP